MSGLNEKGLLPCPFCGGKPRVDLAKKTFCQLHGEPSQAVKVYCYHDCPARPSVESGDVFNGGEAKAREQAIAAWNRRASAPPAPDGLEPVAYYWTEGRMSPDTPMGPAEYDEEVIFDFNPPADGVQFEPLYSATALERVTRERDEARATLDEVCLSNRQEWQRATTAEAKLAEARKVIEPFARAADNAERLAGHDGPLGQYVELEHLRAARRFLEETK